MKTLSLICLALTMAGCAGMGASSGGTSGASATSGAGYAAGLDYTHPRTQAEAVLCEVMRSKEPYRPNECS